MGMFYNPITKQEDGNIIQNAQSCKNDEYQTHKHLHKWDWIY